MLDKKLIGKTKWIVFCSIIFFSLSFGQDFTFQITINSDNHDEGVYELIFGFSPNATDGYDDGIDQYAPPAPPPPAFDAVIGWNNDRYYTQILAGDGELVEHAYNIQQQFGSGNLIYISWNNSGWSDLMGSIFLQDAFGGSMINIDMMNPALSTFNPMAGTFDYTDPINPVLTLTYVAFNILKLKVTPQGGNAVDEELIPNSYRLADAYPNPFNPETTIIYGLKQSGQTTLEIYDLLGRPIKTLVNDYQSAAEYSINWNGTDRNNRIVPSGVYFYKLTSGNYSSIKKVMMLK